MNAVVDTNVLLSGIGFGGKPGVVYEAMKSGVILAYTSDFLLEEVTRNLGKLKIKSDDVRKIERLLRAICVVVKPKTIPTILRDTPDNQVLAITHEADIEAIVTGDKELLAEKEYKGVPIVSVDQFLSKYNLSDQNNF